MKPPTHPAAGQPRRFRAAAPAGAAAAVAVLLYAVTLAGNYVYDDVAVVRDDPRVRSPGLWGRLWTGDYFDGGSDRLYRPLTSTSFAVEWWLHGDRPWVFHGVNVLLHAAAAAGVAELTRRAAPAAVAEPAAWAAGLLFASHPCHVEAVANLVGRGEAAATAGLVWSLVLLARGPLTVSRALSVAGLGVASLLCKEQGLLAPLLWGTFCLTGRPAARGQVAAEPGRRVLLVVATYGWAGYIVFREFGLKLRFDWDRSAMDWTMQPLVRSIGVDRWLVPVELLGRYAGLLLWPAHTSPDYGADVIGSVARWADPYLWIGIGVAGGWAVAVAIAVRRRAGFAAFCLFGAAVSYGLIGNVVALVGTIFGERLVYLPSAFLAALTGLLVARVGGRTRTAVFTVVLTVFGAQTVRWSLLWNRPVELYAEAIEYQPRSLQLHFLLAAELRRADRPVQADAVLAGATRQYPDYWRAWMFRALGAAESGDVGAADRYLTRASALSDNPSITAARMRVDQRRHRPG